MPAFGSISRCDLIHCLRELGFEVPDRETRHGVMVRGAIRVRIPNPHGGDIGVTLLANILRQAQISRKEWEAI